MSRSTMMLGAYVTLAVLQVLGRLLEISALASVTKPLLMPVLAGFLVVSSPRPFTRMVRVVLAALAFSWLGDVLLMGSGDGFFLAGLGGFLVAQLLYIVAFAPVVRASTPPRPPVWALVYVLYGAGMVAVLAPDLGDLLLPVALYAVVICTMAIVASGVNAWTAVGAIFFLVSDTLLAFRHFTDLLDSIEAPGSALSMATYTLAQGLLVYGVVVVQREIWRETPQAVAS